MPNPFAPVVQPPAATPPATGGAPASHGLDTPSGEVVTGDTRISRDIGGRHLDVPPERTPPPPKPTPDPGEERVSRIEQRLDKLGTYLVDLHKFLSNKLATPPASDTPPKGDEPDSDELDPTVKTALEKMFEEKMNPLVEEYRQDRNRDGRAATAATHDDWKKYEPAIDEVAKLVPAETLARPGAWEFLYRYVKVQNYDTLVQEIREQVRAEFEGDGRPTSPPSDMSLRPSSPPAGGNNGKVVLSAREREAADKMGMSHEDYANWKAEPRADQRR